jgi:hypothetical protein
MKLNWLISLMLKGLFIMFLSGVALLLLEPLKNIPGYSSVVTLVAPVLFAAGLMIVMVTSWEYFFNNAGKPNYVYRPEIRQIFVRFSSTSFEIEREGIKLYVQMVHEMPYTTRRLWISEQTSTSFFPTGKGCSGKANENKLTTSDGQTLYFSRHITGIKIWWLEENSPWKIVEKK